MKIDVVPAARLSAEQISAWSRLQRADTTLFSPFFRPEFTLAVAAERDDVEVIAWEQAGEPVGFLPFERSAGNVGWPVGGYVNMFQGAVVRPDVVWTPEDIVRAAGLRGLRFDHLLASQAPFAPYQYVVSDSPYLDLSQGFEHYRRSRGKSAATFVSHILQKDRKAGRDLGDVRLEVNLDKRTTLARLLEWKIDQCREKHETCSFEMDWVVRLHERLLNHAAEDFTGTLFSLYMGDRLASAFFCLQSGSSMQGCILGYEASMGPYAPGLVLLMRVAQMANSLGVTRIDMGSGGDAYKEKLASDFERVAEGAVYARRLFAPVHRRLFWAKDRLRATPLRGTVRRVRRWMFVTRVRMGQIK